MPGGRARRICSSWARAAICCANKVVWMPWNNPSSHPTSWAWATRSSASLGASSSVKGRESLSSSSTSSGARPDSSSLTERSWICRSLTRLFSSSGEARTSSRSWRIMLPIRITLAGCSTMSTSGRSRPWPPPSSPIAMPSGPTTTTLPGAGSRSGSLLLGSVMAPSLSLPADWVIPGAGARLVDEQDLAHVGAVVHDAVCLGRVGHGQGPVDHRRHLPGGDQWPYLVPDVGHDRRLLLGGARPQGGGEDADALAHQRPEVNLRARPAPRRDHEQAA